MAGVLKVKDPADPTGATWIEVAGIGSPGPPGADGAPGPTGPTGPIGPTGGSDVFVLKAQIHAHHIYGPIGSAAAVWTWTLAAGSYLCQYTMSCVASTTGIRYSNLNMDGVQVNQSKHWFNEVSVHHQMNTGVSVITIPADGDYTFDLTMSSSATIDGNDFGFMMLTPCDPGAVH